MKGARRLLLRVPLSLLQATDRAQCRQRCRGGSNHHAEYHLPDTVLKAWAFKLDRMKGELTVQRLVDELYDWTARRMEDARENDSKADEILLKRCAYHGLNFAAPFVVMRHWDCMHQDGNDDVMRCFNLSSDGAVHSKVRRLQQDRLIEKVEDARQSGTTTTVYRKTGVLML